MRILGLDYGSKTVGVAATDALGITVQGIETICREREDKQRKTIARIRELTEKLDIGLIVVGLPLNMDESAGDRAEKSLAFGQILAQKTGIEVVFQDERLTTAEADDILHQMGVKRGDRKKYIDMVAAELILRSYLGSIEEKKMREKLRGEKDATDQG